jgi:DNA repair exonuclease SbcCD nuclease subunit
VKLLLCSDAHVDASTAGFSRFEDVRDALWDAALAAVEERVDFFVFLGDLCDPDRGHAHESVALAIEVAAHIDIAGGNIPQWWLTGNHDVLEDGSGTSTIEPLGAALKAFAWPSSRVISKPAAFDGPTAGGVALVAFPYVARAQSYDPIAALETAAQRIECPELRKVIIFSHLMLEGMQPGSETIDMSRGRDVFLPLDAIRARWGDKAVVFSGHYHRREVHRGVQIVGSLVNLTFGEQDNKPGYLIVEVT